MEGALSRMMRGNFKDVRPSLETSFESYSYGRKMISEDYKKQKPIPRKAGFKPVLKIGKKGASGRRKNVQISVDRSPGKKSSAKRDGRESQPGSASKHSSGGRSKFRESAVQASSGPSDAEEMEILSSDSERSPPPHHRCMLKNARCLYTVDLAAKCVQNVVDELAD